MDELLIKQLEMVGQEILKEHKNSAQIKFKDIRRGKYRKGNIIIPLWCIKYGKHFAIYYVIHEVSHAIDNNRELRKAHSKEFKKIEKDLLLRFNIIPIYARAYAKKLINREGIILYEKG